MTRATFLPLVCVLIISGAAWGAEGELPARVTMIDADTSPADTPGPGNILSGIVALDYNNRSLVMTFDGPITVTRVVLKSDPASDPAKGGNVHLDARNVSLFSSNDNNRFQKVAVRYHEPDNETIVLDGFKVTARYLKVNTLCGKGTNYQFCNYLERMIAASGSVAQKATSADKKEKKQTSEGRPYLADVEIEKIEAVVTMIDSDTQPTVTGGPGAITSGVVALDCSDRSLFVEMDAPEAVSSIVLRSDPSTHRAGTSNRNLTADTLQLYSSNDNKSFKRVPFRFAAPDKDTIVLDRFLIKARYIKIHTTCGRGTNYAFVNYLNKLTPGFVAAGLTGKSYYELPDPLFEELLSDKPGPRSVLYWSANCNDELDRLRPWFRANAKRFGYRYVFEEQLEETATHNMIYSGKHTPWLREHDIPTWRFIIGDPGQAFVPSIDGMPLVFDPQGWLMDPRWQKQYFENAVQRAKAREQWALSAGDETWEVFAINAVPKEKRYKEVEDADREILEKYGSGKYGMPDGKTDADPFRRIAHRRWVSDKLTELYEKTAKAVREAAPDMVLMAPDFASGVPAADIEAWAPHFDIFQGQCSSGPQHFVAQFCVGCDTKVLRDLSDKACWMSVQNATPPNYGYTVTPEHIREMYSQVFRNGGQGLFLLASEWYERELNHPKFAEPAKWRALLYVVETATSMNQVKVPDKADCAILYSSDSLLTLQWAQLNNGDWELYSNYTALGPVLRSWFHIVSDRQIERGIRSLSDYKVLYIPYAEYERESVLDKIEEYVATGGTVVCTDAEAFTWNINGESLTPRWEKLTGAKRLERRRNRADFRTVSPNPLPVAQELSLSSLVPGWNVAVGGDDVQVIANYEDGSPAVTLRPHGKGRFICFAADPFIIPGGWGAKRSLVAPGTPIVALLEAIQKDVGAAMGHDIWRFKLPPFPHDMYQKEQGRCLTNNYVYDRNEPLLEPNNVDTGGTYSYSRLPDAGAETEKAGDPVPFGGGHLTNRLIAYEGRAKGMPWNVKEIEEGTQRWIVRWTDPVPTSVTFDFTNAFPLRQVKLVFSGCVPALVVKGSPDGVAWSNLAASPEQDVGEDVADLALPVQGSHRYVRLDFQARHAGEKFDLCEVEVWAQNAR